MKERTLRDLFHLVEQAIRDDQQIISISPDVTVAEALDLMRQHGFSQLPILYNNEVIGVFSYRSLAHGLKKLPDKIKNPLSLAVLDFKEAYRFARISDELSALIDEFDVRDAMLVGSEDNLLGIVTTIDVLRYFYSVASPYVMLRQIELAIRELIRAAVDPAILQHCISKSLARFYEHQKRAAPTRLEEMTMADYVGLLSYKETWPQFAKAFGNNQLMVVAKVNDLPDLRNDVFHFRKDLNAEEYETLREIRDWLFTRTKILDSHSAELIRA